MAAETASAGLPMTTAFELPGLLVQENLGVCYGLVVRSMGFVGGVGAAFKGLRRGEIGQYTQLLEDARRHAIDRLVDTARLLGADAVIAMRFDSSEIGQQITAIVAYGTAATGERRPPPKIRNRTRRTLNTSRKIEAAIGTALPMLARRRRLKSKIVKPPNTTSPRIE